MAAIIIQEYLAPLRIDDIFTEVISTRSFEKEEIHLNIFLDASGSLSEYSCHCMTDIESVCNHMYLAERHLSYITNNDTENRYSSRHLLYCLNV